MLELVEDVDSAETEAAERWLDQLDPAAVVARDGSYVRAVIAAGEAMTGAEQTLRRAVGTARATGTSWTVLGAALGTTPEAVEERFGDA